MFARVDTILRTVEAATLVPAASLLKREGNDAVFVVDPDTMTASLVPVTIGIRDGESVQVIADNLEGRSVVTLGQHLLGDGAAVTLPGQTTPDEQKAGEP